ncbi:neprilysin-2 [Drosophila kikkawai]|uniref:Neprilysin-2 n=1 Tax=Drosophila kikkawai TaxID=30033 RepID=A0A6P4IR45_DROKI|nr:neprilysin-2 [Drosophila kikkawai]
MKNIGIAFALLPLLLQLLLTGSGRGHLLSGQPDIDLTIQAQEQLISQHNDSAYVQRLMRLAKSAEMRSYMQPELEACDNFYDYSCGHWPQINPANGVHPRETNYEQLLVKAYHHKQQRLLERPANGEVDELAVLRLKQFYASCLLFRQMPEDVYRRQLQEIVAEFVYVPDLSQPGQEWPTEDFDWLDTVARIKRKYGFNILLLLQLSADRIYVGQPNKIQALPDRQARANVIRDHLESHLGVEEKLAKTWAREIADLEQQISRGMVERRVGILSQLRKPEELDAPNTEAFNVTQYVEIVIDRELDPNETLYEHVPSYLSHLAKVVTDASPQVLGRYIFHELLQHFFYERTGNIVEQCVSRVRDLFPELLDNMVYKQYGDAAILSDIEGIWQQIKHSFRGVLENSSADWLVVETREQLLEHLNATSLVVNGHADVNFTQRYESLELKDREYLQNLKAVFSRETLTAKIIPSTSLVYNPLENTVLLPVALLQPNIMWSRYYPRALRFGSLGTLLAHELAHSLEDASKWDAKSFAEYAKRKACFKEQYGRLRLNGRYLPESSLQAENIADNLAIQVAYHAYRRYLSELATSALGTESLPQLKLSPRQLFFLSYAQLWCNDANEEFRDKQSLLKIRTPNALRVMGALSNFETFGRDFSCSSESRMTTPQKCQLFAASLD